MRIKTLEREYNRFREHMSKVIVTEFARLPLLVMMDKGNNSTNNISGNKNNNISGNNNNNNKASLLLENSKLNINMNNNESAEQLLINNKKNNKISS